MHVPATVFHDAQIKAGDDFLDAIERNLDVCDVLVAVIHPGWGVLDEDDFVRLELRTVCARSLGIVPVLVDGARMPDAQDLPPELRALAACSPLELHADRLVARVREHLRAAEDRRASMRPQLKEHNGNLCWSGVMRGEQEAVYAALLGCMAREHRVKWIDTAPNHEITLLRRRLTHVAQLTVRLKPGAAARTTSVEMTAEPTLRRALERTIASAVGTRRL
jgi:hypothetical protein